MTSRKANATAMPDVTARGDLPVVSEALWWVRRVVMALFVLPVFSGWTFADCSSTLDYSAVLPPGSEVLDRQRDIVTSDLDGDGEKEAVIFAQIMHEDVRSADVFVVECRGERLRMRWSNSLRDSYGFLEPTGVRNLIASGLRQIVAYRGVLSTCPGVLEIFQSNGRSFERITPWSPENSCQAELRLEDLNADGTTEVIFKTHRHAHVPQVYAWNGRNYERADKEFPQALGGDLQSMLVSSLSRDPLPPNARVEFASAAVDMYALRKEYIPAVELCMKLLPMIDDPKLTVWALLGPNAAAEFRRSKLESKVALHNLLSKIYSEAGDGESAQRHQREAAALLGAGP